MNVGSIVYVPCRVVNRTVMPYYGDVVLEVVPYNYRYEPDSNGNYPIKPLSVFENDCKHKSVTRLVSKKGKESDLSMPCMRMVPEREE